MSREFGARFRAVTHRRKDRKRVGMNSQMLAGNVPIVNQAGPRENSHSNAMKTAGFDFRTLRAPVTLDSLQRLALGFRNECKAKDEGQNADDGKYPKRFGRPGGANQRQECAGHQPI